MKKLLFILLLLMSAEAFTQTIWFQMQRVSYCTKETAIDSSLFFLVDKYGAKYKAENGIVWLKGEGEYKIYYPTNPNQEFPLIQIRDRENTYIHKETKIRFAPQHWGLSFQSCEGLLNGVHEDVYDNGNLRIRGNFANGLPKDSLLFFYENGHIQKSIYYLRKLVYVQDYDSSGSLIKVSSNNNRLPVLTDYETTTFYSTGGVKSIEKRKENYVQLTEYYPDKKPRTRLTRKKRIDYYPNGHAEVIHTWKEKLQGKEFASTIKYEITKTSFNTDGEKTEEIKYHSFQGNKIQPSLLSKPSDFVVYWKKFNRNGAEQLILKNKTKYEAVLIGLPLQ
jgi:antitoxin component YwqK of YwqJK toxin-antitoxin module